MKPTIEDIKIDTDLLNKELESISMTDKKRQTLIRKYAGGFCTRCFDNPTKKISYDVGEAKLVEYYCDKCYNFRKESRSKKDLDRWNLN